MAYLTKEELDKLSTEAKAIYLGVCYQATCAITSKEPFNKKVKQVYEAYKKEYLFLVEYKFFNPIKDKLIPYENFRKMMAVDKYNSLEV